MIEHLIDEHLDRVRPTSSHADDGVAGANDSATHAQRVQAVVELIASENDPTTRGLAESYADKLAASLGLADPGVRTLAALKRHLVSAAGRGAMPSPNVPQVQPPHRARSRDRREEVGLEILGALLDFPELFDAPEAEQAAALVEGDVAGGLAALRQAREQGTTDPETVLAKLAAPIHPFARARLAAPRHEKLEDAQSELQGNIKKLKALELSRQKSEVVGELEKAQRLGNFEEQAHLLRELQEKTRRSRQGNA
jgi:hypothetical protein